MKKLFILVLSLLTSVFCQLRSQTIDPPKKKATIKRVSKFIPIGNHLFKKQKPVKNTVTLTRKFKRKEN